MTPAARAAIWSSIGALIIVGIAATQVRAHDEKAIAQAAAGDTTRADWFKSLKQPGTDVTCCDISDCKVTAAEWRDDQWWADAPWGRVPVPSSRVLVKPLSIDGEAYICANPDYKIIYCFVPPIMGY